MYAETALLFLGITVLGGTFLMVYMDDLVDGINYRLERKEHRKLRQSLIDVIKLALIGYVVVGCITFASISLGKEEEDPYLQRTHDSVLVYSTAQDRWI